MRKIIAIILVVMLIVAMTVPAYAATVVPINKIGIKFKMPSVTVPDIPKSVHETVKTTIPSNFMDNWLKANPINIKIG